MENSNMGIGFWVKSDTGNGLSHGQGLSQAQIDFFRNLQVGDRLILWSNTKGGEKAPQFNLKKFQPKVVEESI